MAKMRKSVEITALDIYNGFYLWRFLSKFSIYLWYIVFRKIGESMHMHLATSNFTKLNKYLPILCSLYFVIVLFS